jgi:ubiquinone/menaquinone biosynthesis C-methylase UbiE
VIPPLACPQNWDAVDRKRDAMFEQYRMLDIGGIKPGMVVGEICAGDGYLTFHLASRVGTSGKVYANDIVETKTLKVIRSRAKDKGLATIETIFGSEEDPRFPQASLEMVFCLNAFHEIRKPVEFLRNLVASLKPGAKVVIHEWQLEKPTPASADEERRYTRQEFLEIIAMSPFAVERVDTSLPGPRAVVYVLSAR